MAQRKSSKKLARRGAKKAARASAKKATRKRASRKASRKTARRAAGPVVGTLGMVTLHVSDIQRAVKFYRDTLGLRAGDVMDTPETGWAEIEVARGLKLGLHADKGKMEEGARAPGGATGFYFVVRDVDAAVETLRARGVTIEDKPTDRPYGRDAYIEDPDGNVIALLTPS